MADDVWLIFPVHNRQREIHFLSLPTIFGLTTSSACELDFMARHSPSSPIFLFTTSTVIASFSRCYTGKDILNLNLKPTEVLNSLLASAQGCFL